MPDTHISSQPVLQSIEEQSSSVWGQPPPLPSQQPPHQCSPDWPSRASIATSVTPSQAPSQTPQARRIARPRQPATPSRAPSSQASDGPVSPSTEQLTKADHIHILRLTIAAGDAWGHGTNKAFWKKIANSFEKKTGKKHKSLDRAINNIVKARRKDLAKEESGEREEEPSYTDAVDDWISILDNRKALEDERKRAQGEKDRENAESESWRKRSLMLYSERNEPQPLAKKRKTQLSRQASSQLSRQVSVATNLGTQFEGVDVDDEDDTFSPFADRPIFMDQSTPVSSAAASTAGTIPAPERRRSRPRTETSQDLAIPDLPTDFRRFVDSFVARGATQQNGLNTLASSAGQDIIELKADVIELKTKLGGLEDGIKSIISILRDGP